MNRIIMPICQTSSKRWIANNLLIEPNEIAQLTNELSEMLPKPEWRQKFMDVMFKQLLEKGYVKNRRGKLYVSAIKCPNCGYKENRPGASHCAQCSHQLPPDAEPSSKKSGIICPHCFEIHRKGTKYCPKVGLSIVPVATAILSDISPSLPIDEAMLSPGTILESRFRIIQLLGQGGMGNTYLAEDMRLSGRLCAIKEFIVRPGAESRMLVQQFQFEAEVLARLDHPNAVRILDFFTEGSRIYIVMAFIGGKNLEQTLSILGKLPEKRVKEIALQVLDVLDYLHKQNPPIIFRDIKPSNIMVTAEGRVIVIDFGIARIFKPGKTKDTQAFGTPQYSAPEQYGSGQTDARSDIYGLGATMFHLLTGAEPPHFTDRLSNPIEIFLPKSLNSRLGLVIEKAMEINPNNRFQSAREMKQSLEQVQV